jgi:hypothetical protein
MEDTSSTSRSSRELTATSLRIENGIAVATMTPGIGVEWDREVVEAKSLPELSCPFGKVGSTRKHTGVLTSIERDRFADYKRTDAAVWPEVLAKIRRLWRGARPRG